MSRRSEEDDIQLSVAQTLDAINATWCHVPNGGKRDLLEAKKLKRLGVKPGVPDILIFDPPPASPVCSHCHNPIARGTFIELKTDKGVTSDEQHEWIRRLIDRRWAGGIGVGIDETLENLKKLGYPIRTQ